MAIPQGTCSAALFGKQSCGQQTNKQQQARTGNRRQLCFSEHTFSYKLSAINTRALESGEQTGNGFGTKVSDTMG